MGFLSENKKSEKKEKTDIFWFLSVLFEMDTRYIEGPEGIRKMFTENLLKMAEKHYILT